MLETNIINGSNFITILGMYNSVRVNINNVSVSIFLKTLFPQKDLKLFQSNKLLK